MDRARAFPKEVVRQLDEDYIAALNMIGEGGPEYAAVEEDDFLEENKREEAKAKNLQ
ncbi:hypothetical protein [Planomicrobium sp. CPCC 101079]|uniref:hypothetical protein n=1 Tax=Planomicrobium sp. CPCC 101079 TaxID=2599618 RepID=UPI0016493C72|nr:hypothetical protein [Planomicrobium sp. CPCC 101079]